MCVKTWGQNGSGWVSGRSMIRRIILAVGAIALAGCAHPVDLYVIDPDTGEIGATQINARQTSGPIHLEFHGELYSGTWIAVRDTGYTSTGLGFTGRYVFSTASVNEADAGNAVANLRSASGNTLRCQIRYGFNQGLLTVTVTSFGQCLDQSGRMYDIQGTSAAVGSRLENLRAGAAPPATARPGPSPSLSGQNRGGAFPAVSSSGGR